MAIVQPKQERSRRTLESLLRAGVRLLESGDPAELRIEEVVSEAGSSIGSFYARFPSKEAYLEALADRLEDDLESRLDRLASEGDDPQGLRATTEALVDALSLDSRQRSALRRVSTKLAERGRTADGEVVTRAVDALGRAGVRNQERGRRATRLMMAAIDGAFLTSAMDGSRQALLEELPDIVSTYLQPESRSSRGIAVDPFDVWA